MATAGQTSASGSQTGPSLRDRLKVALMRLQSIRPDTRGVESRTWLRLRKVMGADAAHIEVTTAGGYVELRGHVPTRELAAQAVEVAKGTMGVRGVLDFLRVK